jgi:2-oxoglutarate dehydrogenase E2 component (dihydrolipoamide succinyltransferase)
MIVDIKMPRMGESLTEGTVIEWKKTIGDSVEEDEILLEIATDKVDSEIPSPVAGTLVEIIGEINKTYDVDTVIARIDTSGKGVIPSPKISKSEDEKPIVHEEILSPAKTVTTPPKNAETKASFPTDLKNYSPVVRKIAEKENISQDELLHIPGTGHQGRVTKKDVEFYLKTRGSAPSISTRGGLDATGLSETLDANSIEISEMNTMRKSIAKHMRQSIDTSAHVYVSSEVDMTRIMKYLEKHRAEFKKREGYSLTVTHFITAAVSDALQKFPILNSSLDGGKIIRHKHIHIGIAVSVGDGLVVPPVRNAEELTLLGISRAVSEIVLKARNKKLTLDDLSGSTFSITNFGVFGNLAGYPIINQPNVGILGVGAIKKRPVVIETETGDTIGIRHMAIFTLGIDHRLVDGANGGMFIEEIVKNLETFDLDTLFDG